MSCRNSNTLRLLTVPSAALPILTRLRLKCIIQFYLPLSKRKLLSQLEASMVGRIQAHDVVMCNKEMWLSVWRIQLILGPCRRLKSYAIQIILQFHMKLLIVFASLRRSSLLKALSTVSRSTVAGARIIDTQSANSESIRIQPLPRPGTRTGQTDQKSTATPLK